MPVGLKVGDYEMTNCCGGKIKEPKNCSVCGRELFKVYGLKDEIEFRSKSFLRNQVRSMVGCLKYLAEKKWNIKKFENVLKSKKRKNCAPPAPACGLYLEKVIY